MVVNCKMFDVMQFPYKADSVKTQKSNLAATMATLNTLDMTADTEIRLAAKREVLSRACVLDSTASTGYGANLQKLDDIVKKVNDTNDALQANVKTEEDIKDELKHLDEYKGATVWMPMVKSYLGYQVDESEIDEYATVEGQKTTMVGVIDKVDADDEYSFYLKNDPTNISPEDGLMIGMYCMCDKTIGNVTDIVKINDGYKITTNITTWTANQEVFFGYNKTGSVDGKIVKLNDVKGLMVGMMIMNMDNENVDIIVSIDSSTTITTADNLGSGTSFVCTYMELTKSKTDVVITKDSVDITVPDVSGLTVGMVVVDTLIPTGATIKAITGTKVTLTNAATGSNSDAEVTFEMFIPTNLMTSVLQSYFYSNGNRKSNEEILSTIYYNGNVKLTDTGKAAPDALYLSDYKYIKDLQSSVRSFSKTGYNHNSDYFDLNQLIQSKMSMAEVDARIQTLNDELTNNDDASLLSDAQSALKLYEKYNFDALNTSLANRLQECRESVSGECGCFDNYRDYVEVENDALTTSTDAEVINGFVDNINTEHNVYLKQMYLNSELQMAICMLFDDTSGKVITDPMSQLKKM